MIVEIALGTELHHHTETGLFRAYTPGERGRGRDSGKEGEGREGEGGREGGKEGQRERRVGRRGIRGERKEGKRGTYYTVQFAVSKSMSTVRINFVYTPTAMTYHMAVESFL